MVQEALPGHQAAFRVCRSLTAILYLGQGPPRGVLRSGGGGRAAGPGGADAGGAEGPSEVMSGWFVVFGAAMACL